MCQTVINQYLLDQYCQRTSWQQLFFEHGECVAAAVLLLDHDVVAWVEALEVEVQGAAEVVDANLAVGVRRVRVTHRRFLLEKTRTLSTRKDTVANGK